MEERLSYSWIDGQETAEILVKDAEYSVAVSYTKMPEDLDFPKRLLGLLKDLFKDVVVKCHILVKLEGGKVVEVSAYGMTSKFHFTYQVHREIDMEGIVKVLEGMKMTLVTKLAHKPTVVTPAVVGDATEKLFRYLRSLGLTDEEACVMIDMASQRILKSKIPLTEDDYEKVYEHLRYHTPSRTHLAELVYRYAATVGIAPPQSEQEIFNILRTLRREFFDTFREKIKDAEVFKQKSTDWSMVWLYFILHKMSVGEFPPKKGGIKNGKEEAAATANTNPSHSD